MIDEATSLRQKVRDLEEENRQLRDKVPGPTKQFPLGKVNEDDEGELNVAIYTDKKGTIFLDFGKPTAWIGLDPTSARLLASKLTKYAEEM